MTLTRFVVGILCALMRESQHLGALLAAKTLILYDSPIGKTRRRDLKVFHEPAKELRLSQQWISRGPLKPHQGLQ